MRKARAKWLLPAAGVAVAAVLFVGLVWLPHWIDRRVKDAHSGPLHAYQMQPVPQFLGDALALEKALESLARDGYDPAVWRPGEDDRTRAPDGTPDTHLVRNTLNPNSGRILFRDTSGSDRNPTRVVSVELKGGRVECVVVTPK